MFRREIWFSFKVLGASCLAARGSINITLSSKVSLCRKMSCVTIPELQHRLNETNGQIQVIFGPMFSGKTTELMRRIKRYQVANHSCLVIKYEKDDRYDAEGVSTHDQQKLKATACSQLYSVKDKALNYTVIGVDEGQFFPDVLEFCEDMASRGKIVVVAALDGTYQRKPFGHILNLVPLAESVVKLSAVCMNCFNDASFTKRLGQEKQVEIIGGADKYMAVCRRCYHFASVKELLAGSSIRRHNHFY